MEETTPLSAAPPKGYIYSKSNFQDPQLENEERILNELIQKKRSIDKSLANIEVSIYALETAYLDETPYGNIVRGFDSYVSRTDRRSRKITEQDRIFSNSSQTYLKALDMSKSRTQQDDKLKSLKKRKGDFDSITTPSSSNKRKRIRFD